MKHVTHALAALALAASVGLSAPGAHAVESGDSQGCTPGYWKVKQHHDSWQEAKPSQLFTDKFGFAGPTGSDYLDGLTMLEALQGGGGGGLEGAREILARAAAAAYLNAAYDAPDGSAMYYPWRRNAEGEGGRPPLLETVRETLLSGDRQAMLDLAAWLDEDNNLGCPLS